MRVLVSLHDVTPFHQRRLERAERLFAAVGVSEVLYLVVPNFHGKAPIERDRTFAQWCERERPFIVRWGLHGYYHREPAGAVRSNGGIADWLKRRLLTDGEAEFLSLTGAPLTDRLSRGRAVFSGCLHAQPDVFVAPAWLFNEALPGALARAGIRYTEDHVRVYDIVEQIACSCPVITWSTRTALRRSVSRRVSTRLLHRWRHEPVIRIAVHPFDFDFPRCEAHIAGVLEAALARRACRGYPDLFGAR